MQNKKRQAWSAGALCNEDVPSSANLRQQRAQWTGRRSARVTPAAASRRTLCRRQLPLARRPHCQAPFPLDWHRRQGEPVHHRPTPRPGRHPLGRVPPAADEVPLGASLKDYRHSYRRWGRRQSAIQIRQTTSRLEIARLSRWSVTLIRTVDRGGSRNFHLGRSVKGQANLG